MERERMMMMPGGLGMMLAMLQAQSNANESEDDEEDLQELSIGRKRCGDGNNNNNNKRTCSRLLCWSDALQQEMTAMGLTNAESVANAIWPEQDDIPSREFFLEKMGLKKTSTLDVVSVIFANWFPDPMFESLDQLKRDFINDTLVSPDVRATQAFFAKILLYFKTILTSLRSE